MIREKLLEILVEITGTDEVRKNLDINLFEHGLLDSFGTIELFVAISEQIHIEISPTEVNREMWASPNKISTYLEERAGQ